MDRLEDHLVDLLADHGELLDAVLVGADQLVELGPLGRVGRQRVGGAGEVGAGPLGFEGKAEGRAVGHDLWETSSHLVSFTVAPTRASRGAPFLIVAGRRPPATGKNSH